MNPDQMDWQGQQGEPQKLTLELTFEDGTCTSIMSGSYDASCSSNQEATSQVEQAIQHGSQRSQQS